MECWAMIKKGKRTVILEGYRRDKTEKKTKKKEKLCELKHLSNKRKRNQSRFGE